MSSCELARRILSLEGADDRAARRVLEAAFAGDGRPVWTPNGWTLAEPTATVDRPGDRPADPPSTDDAPTDDAPTDSYDEDELPPQPDCVFLLLDGAPVPNEGFRLSHFSLVRMREGTVLAACAGQPEDAADYVVRAARDALAGAVAVCHDPPGALRAFERWLDVPLDAPLSLRRLAQDRLDLPARHTWEDLAGVLHLSWHETKDAVELADAYAAALDALREEHEGIRDLQATLAPRPPVPWESMAFTPQDLDRLPDVPGVYRFFDVDDNLLYVGKSKELGKRVRSYFRDRTRPSSRVAPWIERVHRFEIDPSGSELEALLREARAIRERQPEANVQRQVHPTPGRAGRLRSVLILEPGEGTSLLRAYLIRDGRWIGSVGIGPRGGGLKLVQRYLDQYFFDLGGDGPRPCAGDAIDVEIVARWLTTHRDRVVAFDPTDLGTSREVIERLNWFVRHGGLVDPDDPRLH